MKLYCFSSNSIENFDIGIKNKIWASPISSNDRTNKTRLTKSKKISKNDKGILYCSENKFYSCPFLFENSPNEEMVISDVWEGNWILPFKFSFLGNELKKVPANYFNKHCGLSVKEIKGLTSPLTSYSAVDLSEETWEKISEIFDI